jgi:hypothetical protein
VLSNEYTCANIVELLCYAGKAKEKDDADEIDYVTDHQVFSDAATTRN